MFFPFSQMLWWSKIIPVEAQEPSHDNTVKSKVWRHKRRLEYYRFTQNSKLKPCVFVFFSVRPFSCWSCSTARTRGRGTSWRPFCIGFMESSWGCGPSSGSRSTTFSCGEWNDQKAGQRVPSRSHVVLLFLFLVKVSLRLKCQERLGQEGGIKAKCNVDNCHKRTGLCNVQGCEKKSLHTSQWVLCHFLLSAKLVHLFLWSQRSLDPNTCYLFFFFCYASASWNGKLKLTTEPLAKCVASIRKEPGVLQGLSTIGNVPKDWKPFEEIRN